MLTRNLLLLISTLVWLSCTKDPIEPKVEPPVVVPTDTTKNEPTFPKDKYEIRKVQLQMSELFADDNIDEQVYLGGIWHLKDTIEGPRLESLESKAKKVKFHFLSHNDASVDLGFFEPSYNNVLNYANKFEKSKQVSSIIFSSSTFEDYAQIQGYLGNSKDVKKIFHYPIVENPREQQFYKIEGEWLNWMYRYTKQQNLGFMGFTVECGTVGKGPIGLLRSLKATIDESRLFAGRAECAPAIRKRFDELYIPSSKQWRKQVLKEADLIFEQMVQFINDPSNHTLMK